MELKKTKFDLSNLSGREFHIWISSSTQNSSSEFAKNAYGFSLDLGSRRLFFTDRHNLILSESFYQFYSFLSVLFLIEQYSQESHELNLVFYIYFKTPESYDSMNLNLLSKTESIILNSIIERIFILERSGIEFVFSLNSESPALERHIKEALSYQLIDDFQSKTIFRTTRNSKLFNFNFGMFESKKDYEIIEYVSDSYKSEGCGVVSIRNLIVGDEEKVSEELNGFKINSSMIYPSSTSIMNSEIRLMALTIKDSEISILYVNCDSCTQFSTKDLIFLNLARYFNKPFLIFDLDSKLWFEKSKSMKRDLVTRKQKTNFFEYKNIAYYITNQNAESAWEWFRKKL